MLLIGAKINMEICAYKIKIFINLKLNTLMIPHFEEKQIIKVSKLTFDVQNSAIYRILYLVFDFSFSF